MGNPIEWVKDKIRDRKRKAVRDMNKVGADGLNVVKGFGRDTIRDTTRTERQRRNQYRRRLRIAIMCADPFKRKHYRIPRRWKINRRMYETA